ncbi:adenosine deaminase [Pseudohoeflea coraliihabitans]|uniref:Adenosine deaminase n=1 Tax=Pseudohoeflea coraliihabitans TaxID=2860393 RepID=A0ABS6WPB0_9HYPH|nr:adenosine deaminase [Pseudohoeflea sp. DP4N28-3]MBW3097793.1 adenosine deaminase [Pseudohoeflea sp. DP4N28-3]
MDTLIADVKKAEIHCHIEGAVPADLVLRQAAKYGVDTTPFLAEGSYVWSDFTSFLSAYDQTAQLFRTPEDYAALAAGYLTGIAAEGAIYAEIFISPDHARQAGLSPEAYFEGLGEGIMQARQRCGIECRMIVTGIRHFGAEAVEAAALLTARRPHPLITGFGMAGEERCGRARDYARAFDIARDADLGLTVHAGELAGPESVRDALDALRPSRIGHGVRAIDDSGLVARLASEGIILEVCPGSNVKLGVYADWPSHPFERLRQAGVRVTLSSDDPPHFDSSIGHEYAMAAQTWGYDASTLTQFTQTALETAFVDEPTRQKLLGQLG